MYESSNKRGQGYSFATDYPLSFNFSGALLSLLSESIDSFRAVIDETFGEKSNSNRDLNLHRRSLSHMPIEESRGAMVSEETRDVDGNGMEVIHEIPKKLKLSDRVAFSLRNLSGQRMRIHQQQRFVYKNIIVLYIIECYKAKFMVACMNYCLTQRCLHIFVSCSIFF